MRQSTAAAAIALLASASAALAAPYDNGQTVLGLVSNHDEPEEPPHHPIPERPSGGKFNPLHRE
jgi:hypothetical protein